MGICKYCGEKVGLFKDVHPECEKYTLEVKKIIEKKKYDQEYLESIQKELEISESVATKIYKDCVGVFINDFINGIILQERYTPEKEAELKTLADDLKLNLSFNNNVKQQLEKYRLFWKIDNGELPIENTDISLQAKETCHFISDIEWHEQRKVTKRVNYSGIGTRVRLMKGVSLRLGSITPQRITEDVWQLIDSGRLYLTNKRIIFMGQSGNKTIALNKILDFQVYSNGIEIDKDTGKSPFFKMDNNSDTCAFILSKLINKGGN